MSSMPKGQDSDDIVLAECLYWDCPCGQRNFAYWIPEELSAKHCQRIRKRGRGVGQTVWNISTPRQVMCDRCGKQYDTKPFLAD